MGGAYILYKRSIVVARSSVAAEQASTAQLLYSTVRTWIVFITLKIVIALPALSVECVQEVLKCIDLVLE